MEISKLDRGEILDLDAPISKFINEQNSLIQPALDLAREELKLALTMRLDDKGHSVDYALVKMVSIDVDDFQSARHGEIWIDISVYSDLSSHTPLSSLRIRIEKRGVAIIVAE